MKNLTIAVIALAFSLALTSPIVADTYVSGEPGIQAYGPISLAVPTTEPDWDTLDWGVASPAVDTWVHGSWPSIAGATWISTAYYVEDSVNDSWRKFVHTFEIPWYGVPSVGSIDITSDNAEVVYINGQDVGRDGEIVDPHQDNQEWGTVLQYTIPATSLNAGTNTLEIIVRNYRMSGGTTTSNPVGVIYKMTIDYAVPGAVWVPIDIKPGSWPNAINLCSNGVIPVAILSTADFDATAIVPTSVTLAGAEVAVRGKGKSLANEEDVDGDGLIDLVVQVETEGLNPDEFVDTYALVTAELEDGTTVWGYDEVLIVPPEEK